jgi:hypothetical protein
MHSIRHITDCPKNTAHFERYVSGIFDKEENVEE